MEKKLAIPSKFREEVIFRNNNHLKNATFRGKDSAHQRKQIKLFTKLLEKSGLDLETLRKESAKDSKEFVTKASLKFSSRKLKRYPFHTESLLKKIGAKNFVKLDPRWVGIIEHTMDSDGPGVADSIDVKPNAVGEINTFVEDIGSGLLGIEAAPVGAHAHRTIIVEYTFVPTQTGLWTIFAGIDFHGFYVLYADDQAWNSREASVKLEVSISASQYFLGPEQKQTVLDIGDDNINASQNFDDHTGLIYLMHFKQGDPVTVSIKISMKAYAKGDDSHAELNFADGNANFIKAGDLFAFSS